MADEGFKYAINNKNAKGNINPLELGYSSKFNTIKTSLSGFVSVAAGASGFTTKQIPHGLPYRPAFNVYFRDPVNGEVYQCKSTFDDAAARGSGTIVNVHASSDNYNLTFEIYNTTGSIQNVDIFYEVFYQDLTTEPVFAFG